MFKSGRFSPEEDSEIKKHFGMLIFDLKVSQECLPFMGSNLNKSCKNNI